MRYFVAVAEELHFRRAAERLFISTPTLSQQIKAVEREIGGPLLIRRPEGVSLTPAGEILLRTARGVLAAADDAVRATREAAGTAAPVLRFGLLNGVPPRLIERITSRLDERVDSRLDMTSGTTAELARLLEAGRLDLVMLRAPVDLPPQLRSVHVASEELGVLMSEQHDLAGSASVTLADLAGREMVLFPRASAPQLHDSVLAALNGVVLSTSAMGYAPMLAVLPLRPDVFGLSSARAAGVAGLAWRPIEGRPLVVEYVAAWSAHNPRAAALVGG